MGIVCPRQAQPPTHGAGPRPVARHGPGPPVRMRPDRTSIRVAHVIGSVMPPSERRCTVAVGLPVPGPADLRLSGGGKRRAA